MPAILGLRDREYGAPHKNAAFRTGQLLAIASAIVTIALFIVFFFFNPYGQVEQPSSATFGRMIHLMVSAALAAMGGIQGKRSWLVAAFAIGFFPWWIGLYLLLSPGIFKWIPIGQFGYLAAAWLIGRKRERVG